MIISTNGQRYELTEDDDLCALLQAKDAAAVWALLHRLPQPVVVTPRPINHLGTRLTASR